MSSVNIRKELFTFSPLALLMARRGLSTLSTRRILTTEIALELKPTTKTNQSEEKEGINGRPGWDTESIGYVNLTSQHHSRGSPIFVSEEGCALFGQVIYSL